MWWALVVCLCIGVSRASVVETCGVQGDVKLFATELGAASKHSEFLYVMDSTGDDELHVLLRTVFRFPGLQNGSVFETTDGGHNWVSQDALMEGVLVSGPPRNFPGVVRVVASADGTLLVALSYKYGYWRKDGGSPWRWIATTDYLDDLQLHPTDRSQALGTFKSPGCETNTNCFITLRYTKDGCATWTDVASNVWQFAWSTRETASFYYAAHYDGNVNFYSQSWWETKLWKGTVQPGGRGFTSAFLLDHCGGLVYRNGTLLAASQPTQESHNVYLYTSVDEGATPLIRSLFRTFMDDEVEASSYTILDMTSGSLFVNVRTDRDDRGDLYQSAAWDHDFTMVLMNNIRKGRGDFSRLASLRGIYMANVIVPPDDQVITAITYDMGGRWDFLRTPQGMESQCNSSTPFIFCGLHFLGRSNDDIGEAPYSAAGAIGLAMGTGTVGDYLDKSHPEKMGTFFTRDGGVTWKRIATGNNVYAMADRGAVVLWAPNQQSSSEVYWSWDEGKTSSACAFGVIGNQSVYSVSSSPSRDGLRIHMLTQVSSPTAPTKYFVITADFSSLADTKCTGADTPNTPASHYETWTPRDPDGQQGCLLGSLTTYVRRKQTVRCFNVDNDIIQSTRNCACERIDYECDDCYFESEFWNKSSDCVKRAGPCEAAPNPCAHGETSYLETRGYRLIPFDTCISNDATDAFKPVLRACVNGNTQPPASSTTSPSSGGSTSSPGSSSSGATTNTPPATSGSSSSATATTSSTAAPGSAKYIVVAVMLLLIIGGLVVGFIVLRRNPAFQRRFGGKVPAWLVPPPVDPYSTLGELDAPSTTGLDDDDF